MNYFRFRDDQGRTVYGSGSIPPEGAVELTTEAWQVEIDAIRAAALVPTAPSELLAYAEAAQAAALAQVFTFDMAVAGGPAHPVTTRLDDRGQSAMIKVALWAQLNAANAQASLPYSNVDFSGTTLNPAEADILAAKAGAIDARGYAILNQVAAGVLARPPSITNAAQIDAAFAALATA